ncbi:MAG: ribosome-associated translation inhibitor RaiA [Myxococcota bacterium]|nr:ribosome-associated translation inhibitor RaiA [Myxococcota bacterium]
MDIAFTFRNLESSEAIKSYATEKLAKLQKLLRAPMHAEVTVSLDRHEHQVDVAVSARGRRYAGSERSADMYASIDLVLDKIHRQVRDAKAAVQTRKRHPTAGTLRKAGSVRASKR